METFRKIPPYDYYELELDTFDFKLPQKRKRLFVVGFKRKYNMPSPIDFQIYSDQLTIGDIKEDDVTPKIPPKLSLGVLSHKERRSRMWVVLDAYCAYDKINFEHVKINLERGFLMKKRHIIILAIILTIILIPLVFNRNKITFFLTKNTNLKDENIDNIRISDNINSYFYSIKKY